MSEMFRGVDGVRHALDYHLSRHNVVSSNIANAETPGFRPQELLREREQTPLATLPLEVTSSSHVGNKSEAREQSYEVREDRTAAPVANGNSVSL